MRRIEMEFGDRGVAPPRWLAPTRPPSGEQRQAAPPRGRRRGATGGGATGPRRQELARVSRRRLLGAVPLVGVLAACGGLPEVANPLARGTATAVVARRLRVVISALDNARPFLEVAIGKVPESKRIQFDVVGLTPVRTDVGLRGDVQTIPRDFTVWP